MTSLSFFTILKSIQTCMTLFLPKSEFHFYALTIKAIDIHSNFMEQSNLNNKYCVVSKKKKSVVMVNNTVLAFTCVILKIHFLDTQAVICFCLSRCVYVLL